MVLGYSLMIQIYLCLSFCPYMNSFSRGECHFKSFCDVMKIICVGEENLHSFQCVAVKTFKFTDNSRNAQFQRFKMFANHPTDKFSNISQMYGLIPSGTECKLDQIEWIFSIRYHQNIVHHKWPKSLRVRLLIAFNFK